MSDTTQQKPKTRPTRRRLSEVDQFRQWLEGLGFQSKPIIHVNGASHSTAVVVVDFGTPLAEPLKLTADQSAELIGYIRSNTKSLYRDRDVMVRVQNDNTTGIWWSNVT